MYGKLTAEGLTLTSTLIHFLQSITYFFACMKGSVIACVLQYTRCIAVDWVEFTTVDLVVYMTVDWCVFINVD